MKRAAVLSAQQPNKRPLLNNPIKEGYGNEANDAPQPTTRADDGDDLPDEVFNDTIAALHVLKSRFPKIPGVPPFCLKSQLYTILTDKTTVDREIEDLRHTNALRIFKLQGLQDEYALMLLEDYHQAVYSSRKEAALARAVKKNPSLLEVFDWFIERVLPECEEFIIDHETLVRLLGNARPSASSSSITEDHVALLLQYCCLTRHTGTSATSSYSNYYCFAIPNAGPAIRSILPGRKEVIGMLQRRKHPEMLEAELLKRQNVKGSVMGIKWHLSDLLGSGHLMRLQTTVGPLIRIGLKGMGAELGGGSGLTKGKRNR